MKVPTRLDGNYNNVEKIVVDTLSHSSMIAVFDRKVILNNQERIQQFKCRMGFEQRPK